LINPTLENPSGLDVDPLSKEKSDGEEFQMDIEVGCKGSLWSEGVSAKIDTIKGVSNGFAV